MASYDLGTVKGSVSIDIAQAVASYAALRRANAATDTALLESSRSLKAVGAGLVGIGAVALVGFGVAVKAAADFQAKMRFFQVVTGSSKKEMAAATQEAFKLAKTSGYTAGQIADAFVELGKAGINAKDIVSGVGSAVATLAAAAQIPMKDSAEIIVNTMKTFQIGAGGAAKIADLLAGAANASTIDIQDLAFSLKYVGGTAEAIGVPLQDVTNALGQLGNAGVRGSTGGTALRKILISLAPVSKQATKELEKLGIIQTNGGVSADQYAKAQTRQKAAIDNLRKAQQHLIDVQRLAVASANDKSAAAKVREANSQAAASRSLATAQDRLSTAQQHLQAVQAKYASSPLAATAAQQASRFAALQAAQQRVAAAQEHLAATQQKVNSAASGSTTSSATQLRAAIQLRDAQEKVKEAADKARAAGVTVAPGIEKLTNLFFDATGKAKPLSEIFQILQDHMKGMTQQQKVTALNIIFGNRAISSALILTRAGAKGFQEFGKQMNQVSAADVMRKRLDTLSGAWKKFQGAMSVALIQAGSPAQTPLKILVQLLTRVVTAFTDLPGPVQAVLSTMVLLFGVITAGVGSFILLVGFIGKATRAYRQFKLALAFVKEIQLVQRAMALLNITMLANPVVLIVVAVIALAAALAILIIKVKPVRDFFIDLGKAIFTGLKAAFDWLMKNWDLLTPILLGPVGVGIIIWKRFGGQIIGFLETAITWIKKNWVLLAEILLGPAGWAIIAWHHFGDEIKKVPGVVLSALGSAGSAILNFFTKLPDLILFTLGFIIGRLLRWQGEMIATVFSWGVKFVRAVVSFFEQLPGRIASLMTAFVDTEVRGWTRLYNESVRLVKAMFFAVVNFFERLPGRIGRTLASLVSAVGHGFSEVYHAAINWAKSIPGAIGGFFEKLPGRAKSALTSLWSQVTSVGATIISAVTNIGSSSISGIMKFFNDLPGMIYNALLNAIKSIGNLAGKAFDEAKHWGGSLWNGFKKGLFGSPRTKIEYALEDMTATADKETKKLRAQVKILNGLATRIPAGALLSHSTGAHRTPTATASGVPVVAGGPSKSYDVKIYNPAPEPAGPSVERVLNNLEFVGA